MNLVFIYGPPAVGKLTVAEELSSICGYAVFHNHLTRDLVANIYGQSLSEHYDLVNELRNTALAYCANHDTSLIFTLVYDGEEDNKIVESYANAVLDNGGQLMFVELSASKDDLLKRVSLVSRKKYQKLNDPAVLEKLIKDSSASVPYPNILKINTSLMDPSAAAQTIAKHFGLPNKLS